MTLCKYECMILSHDVSKIMTACMMLQISIAQRQMKAKIHSFPTMYILGGGSISNSPCSILPKPYLYRAGIDMVFCLFVVLNKTSGKKFILYTHICRSTYVQKFLKQNLQKTISTPGRYRYGFSDFFSFNSSS